MIAMSGEGSFGIGFVEKTFGLLILFAGSLATYFTLTSSSELENFAGFFGALSVILIILGLLLITAKTE